MAIPELVRHAATRRVEAFCERRVPSHVRAEVRLEFLVRGNNVTIVERRAPWRPEYGPEWSSLKIAQLRYAPATSMWSLNWRNRNERWFVYSQIAPSCDIALLLSEIDADPTGIFWG
ncbi:MAG: DUF3024 domain-containing protein [Gaiellaceae bacterium]